TPPTAEPDLQTEFPNGQIPLTRHQEILATTRQKQQELARQELLKEFGPWNHLRAQFTPDEFGAIVQDLQDFHRAPERFLRKMASELGYQLLTPGQSAPQSPPGPRRAASAIPEEVPGPDLQFQGSDG